MGEVDGDLKAREGKEIFVGQVVVRHDDLVIGEGDNGVSVRQEGAFDLVGRHFTVRNHGVHVQVCLVKFPLSGQQILFHVKNRALAGRRAGLFFSS